MSFLILSRYQIFILCLIFSSIIHLILYLIFYIIVHLILNSIFNSRLIESSLLYFFVVFRPPLAHLPRILSINSILRRFFHISLPSRTLFQLLLNPSSQLLFHLLLSFSFLPSNHLHLSPSFHALFHLLFYFLSFSLLCSNSSHSSFVMPPIFISTFTSTFSYMTETKYWESIGKK